MKIIPIVSSEVGEIASLANSNSDLAKRITVLLDSGTPLTCADVDGSITDSAGNRILTYHLSDPLKVLLVAARAENINTVDVPMRNTHDATPN